MPRMLLAVIALMIAVAPPVAAQPLQPGWIADAKGCRVWNPNPQPNETIAWTGGCVEGYASGRGVLQWYTNGRPTDRFEGEYRNGRREGRGIYVQANGARYDGEYVDDRRHGRGIWSDADGRYVGEWRDGRRNGRGVWVSTRGDHYTGEYRDGLRSGHGVYTFRDGARYVGQFRDDVPNGQGIYTLKDGRVISGEWVDGSHPECPNCLARRPAALYNVPLPWRECFANYLNGLGRGP